MNHVYKPEARHDWPRDVRFALGMIVVLGGAGALLERFLEML